MAFSTQHPALNNLAPNAKIAIYHRDGRLITTGTALQVVNGNELLFQNDTLGCSQFVTIARWNIRALDQKPMATC